MMNQVPYRVLLPEWIWEKAQNQKEIKKFVLEYMKRYPHLRVRKISGKYAICELK